MLQVVTDSSCDLPKALLQRCEITTVPVSILIDGETYLEGETITTHEFYAKMARSLELPKTAQPAPGLFAETFRTLAEKGPVLCVTLSSKLSGTYQSACLGRDLSGVDVTVFDTLTASLGHGLQVLRASELARAGHALGDVLAKLGTYRDEMNTLVMLNTLENIVRGGRLAKVWGSLSQILNIRVLLHDVDGDVGFLAKVHGSRKLMDRVVQTVSEMRPYLSDRDVGIAHYNNPLGVETLKDALAERCRPRGFVVGEMGPALATYAGEGGIIVAF